MFPLSLRFRLRDPAEFTNIREKSYRYVEIRHVMAILETHYQVNPFVLLLAED